MRRLLNIGDALSQLMQVTFAPRAQDTSANESLSGRSYREGWWTQRVIDAIFFWEPDHCRLAAIRDRKRAIEYLIATADLPDGERQDKIAP